MELSTTDSNSIISPLIHFDFVDFDCRCCLAAIGHRFQPIIIYKLIMNLLTNRIGTGARIQTLAKNGFKLKMFLSTSRLAGNPTPIWLAALFRTSIWQLNETKRNDVFRFVQTLAVKTGRIHRCVASLCRETPNPKVGFFFVCHCSLLMQANARGNCQNRILNRFVIYIFSCSQIQSPAFHHLN